MATATASTYTRPAKGIHAGVNCVPFTVVAAAAIADTVNLCKLPDRAVVVDAALHRGTTQGNLAMNVRTYSAGGSTTLAAVLLSAVAAGVARLDSAGGINYQVSMSDAVIDKWANLEIVAASASVTGTIKGYVSYIMDDRS